MPRLSSVSAACLSPWLYSTARSCQSGFGPRLVRIVMPPARLMAVISLVNRQSVMTTSSVVFLSLFSKDATQISSWKLDLRTSVPHCWRMYLGVRWVMFRRVAHHSSTSSRHCRLAFVEPSSRVLSQPNTAATASLSDEANDRRLKP